MFSLTTDFNTKHMFKHFGETGLNFFFKFPTSMKLCRKYHVIIHMYKNLLAAKLKMNHNPKDSQELKKYSSGPELISEGFSASLSLPEAVISQCL